MYGICTYLCLVKICEVAGAILCCGGGSSRRSNHLLSNLLKAIWNEQCPEVERPWGWFFECKEWMHPIDDEYFVSTYRRWLHLQSQIGNPVTEERANFIAGKGDYE